MQHFLSIAEMYPEDLLDVLERGFELRDEWELEGSHDEILKGKAVALYFEKPSLRTRVSMEGAVAELGGRSVTLDSGGVGLGVREAVSDVARVLAGMVDVFAGRVYDHRVLEAMREASDAAGGEGRGVRGDTPMPIVNMLSDREHPCQALADLMTLMDEWGREPEALHGKRLAWIGDGDNNVARSLAWAAAHLGMILTIASPAGYELDEETLDDILEYQMHLGIFDEAPVRADYGVSLVRDPYEAVAGADAVFTDTFVSMGQEGEKEERLKVFWKYQVNESLMRAAPDHAIVLHCLPAYRGVEITDAVLDGSRSRAFREAHNRLHAQKGLLAELLA